MVKRIRDHKALLMLSALIALMPLLVSCRRDDVDKSKEAAAIARAVLMGNATSSRNEIRWIEEMKLHDGSLVQVERSARKTEDTLLNPTGGRLVGNDLFYRPLNVRWESRPRAADWVLAFDIFDGVPYLVVDGAGWEYCKKSGPDTYDAQFLKWQGGRWVQVSQRELPLQQFRQNTMMAYWGTPSREPARGLVAWDSKVQIEGWRNGEPELLVEHFQRRRATCGQQLPHLFSKAS